MAKFSPDQTVYCRFTGEAFAVVSCEGAIVTLRNVVGNISHRIVGEITITPPDDDGGRRDLLPMDRACLAYLAQHDGVVPTIAIPARLFVGAIPAETPDLVDLGFVEQLGDQTAITPAGRAALVSA